MLRIGSGFRQRTVYRYTSLLLSLVLTLASPMASVAAGTRSGGGAFAVSGGEEGSWIVKSNKFKDLKISSQDGEDVLETTPMSGTVASFQLDDNAHITKKGGKYHVSVRYASYSIYEQIWLVNPEKNMDFIKWRNDSGAGSIVFPKRDDEGPQSESDLTVPSGWAKIDGYRNAEANEFFLTGDQVKTSPWRKENSMDWGLLEFEMDSLDDYVIIAPCYSGQTTLKPLVIQFDQTTMVEAPEDLKLEASESRTMGFEWTNYAEQMAMSGLRNNSVDVYEYLNDLFGEEVAVKIDGDGSMSAEFTVNTELFEESYGDDMVASIGIASSRDTSYEGNTNKSLYKYLSNETIGTTYTPFDIETIKKDKKLTIEFEDLLDGKLICIETKKRKASNDKGTNPLTKWYRTGFLYLTEAVGSIQPVTVEKENGMVLKTDSATMKDGYVFDAYRWSERESWTDEESETIFDKLDKDMDTYRSYAKDDTSIEIYSYTIKNADGARIIPATGITVDLPVPEGFNTDTTIMWVQQKGSGSGSYDVPDFMTFTENEEGKKVLRIQPTDLRKYDYVIVMYDTGDRMGPEELKKLSPGYYEVRPHIANAGYENRPSMAAPLARGRRAVLHVGEDGTYEAYLETQGIPVSREYGFINKMYYYMDGEKTPVDILSYKSTAHLTDKEWEEVHGKYPDKERSETELNIDELSDEYELIYLDTLKFEVDPSKSEQDVSFVVPLMNAATLFEPTPEEIKSAEKKAFIWFGSGVAKPIDPSECPSYHKNLLWGTIYEAELLLDGIADEASRAALEQAIREARETFDSWGDGEVDGDKILEAVEKLEDAVENSGANEGAFPPGSYEVEIELLDHNEDISSYSENFEDKAGLVVDGSKMTITLNLKENEEVSVSQVDFNSGDTSGTAKPVYSDEETENAAGFIFTIPYTEDLIELTLTVSDSQYPQTVMLKLKSPKTEATVSEQLEKLKEKAASLKAEVEGNLEEDEKYYEKSSLASFQASVTAAESLEENSADYGPLTSEMVKRQEEALTAEYNALIRTSDLVEAVKQKIIETTPFLQELKEKAEEELKEENGLGSGEEDEEEEKKEPGSSSGSGSSTSEGSGNSGSGNSGAGSAGDGGSGSSDTGNAGDSGSSAGSPGGSSSDAGDAGHSSGEGKPGDNGSGAEDTGDDSSGAGNTGAGEEGSGTGSGEEGSSGNGGSEEGNSGNGGSEEGNDGDGGSEDGKPGDHSSSEDAGNSGSGAGNTGAGEEGSGSGSSEEGSSGNGGSESSDTGNTGGDHSGSGNSGSGNSGAGSSDTGSSGSGNSGSGSGGQSSGSGAGSSGSGNSSSGSSGSGSSAAGGSGSGNSGAGSGAGSSSASLKLTKVSRERNLVFAALKATESSAVQAVTDQAAEDGKDSSAAAQTESAGQAEKASDEYDVTDLPDGIYMVDFKLWQYAKNDVSMGNPAIMDAYPDTKGQQAKLEVKDGEIFLYLEFQKMKFNGDTGHLLAMEIMKDLQTTEDGTILDWTPDEPEILEYTDETDDYGPPAGSKYPKLLKFELTDYIVDREGKVTDRIPVQVDVPVMRPANEQPAYLRFYWNTLKPAATKSGADVSELSKTLEEAGKLLKEDGYVKFTKDALQASVDAGNELKLCAVEANVTQDMVDKRQEALVKTMAALIKSSVETESVDKSPLSASISLAKSLVSSSYTLETWNAVDARLDEAQEVNKDRDATLEEVNAATVSLLGAVQALERKPSNVTEEEEYDVADGYYKIKVRLWHSSMNKKSMGDPAVKGTSYVHVEDGEATMRLVTEKMSTSGITTHLYDFFIEENGDYKDADLISTEDSKWIFQFDLPSVGKEFYKCEVDPRVDVMGTDPVPARLRLDWDSISNITESQWDDLEGTVHQSDGRAKFSVRLRDEETGVTVTGNTGGAGVLLETEKKESGAEYDKVSAAVGPSANQFVVYDIKLRNEDEYVQPPEPLKLRLPIPAGYDTTKLLMYRLNDDGSGEWIEGRVTGSYYEATVEHFSIYALVECREDIETVLGGGLGTEAGGKEAAPADANAATASDAVQTAGTVVQEVNGRVIPYTGDDTPVEKMAAAAAAALMIFAATFLPKRKKKEDAENGGV